MDMSKVCHVRRPISRFLPMALPYSVLWARPYLATPHLRSPLIKEAVYQNTISSPRPIKELHNSASTHSSNDYQRL